MRLIMGVSSCGGGLAEAVEEAVAADMDALCAELLLGHAGHLGRAVLLGCHRRCGSAGRCQPECERLLDLRERGVVGHGCASFVRGPRRAGVGRWKATKRG